eukprot:gnl/TRDRNA2_/TRDRNA2_86535_c0_seq1.p1 gnl/TRDRNA2_/TRDRNA2_86535_c0~~gnl/TRDRNA2_/TRDRNA2_86535_c0_seq1.p1  ORF type:complete len:358 (-),score=46.99 gnl/TRDRNA2_/TRDRNA2_86535_c0_seq1:158-1231(-)
MGRISVEPIAGCTLGAVISGANLAALDNDLWLEIEAAFLQHRVLVFPGQHLSPEDQTAFGRRFGEIENIGRVAHFDGRNLESKDLGTKNAVSMGSFGFSNQQTDGKLWDEKAHAMQVMLGNEMWHTDSTYMPLQAKAGLLSARTVVSKGGETEFADMRAAYDALDQATKERIEGLSAYHSLHYSQAALGHTPKVGASYGFHGDAFLRPLVKRHPSTGRPALNVGRHAYGIRGLDAQESEQLLRELVDFACRPPRTYLHSWQSGDIVVWDNRCCMHRARPFDHSEVRSMLGTRIEGDSATEGALETLRTGEFDADSRLAQEAAIRLAHTPRPRPPQFSSSSPSRKRTRDSSEPPLSSL